MIQTIRKILLFSCGIILMYPTVSAAKADTLRVDGYVMTNPFSQNWEVSAGVQGMSFYSNQEYGMNLSKSPFAAFRSQLGLSLAAGKWFSPQIGLRTKIQGWWGRNVISDNKDVNAVTYAAINEQVMVNLTNVLFQYDASNPWGVTPYFGIGWTRNFTCNKNSLLLPIGVQTSYRIKPRIKVYGEIGYTAALSDFDGQKKGGSNVVNSHDKWLTLEIGITYEIGQNKWRTGVQPERDLTQPLRETQHRLRKAEKTIDSLSVEVSRLENMTQAGDSVCQTAEVSIFFEIGNAEITNRIQLENMKKLVALAKEYNRTIVVTGYADSATGDEDYNKRLSAHRAATVIKELVLMGVSPQKIKTVTGGGTDMLSPIPANRRVVLTLQ